MIQDTSVHYYLNANLKSMYGVSLLRRIYRSQYLTAGAAIIPMQQPIPFWPNFLHSF